MDEGEVVASLNARITLTKDVDGNVKTIPIVLSMKFKVFMATTIDRTIRVRMAGCTTARLQLSPPTNGCYVANAPGRMPNMLFVRSESASKSIKSES